MKLYLTKLLSFCLMFAFSSHISVKGQEELASCKMVKKVEGLSGDSWSSTDDPKPELVSTKVVKKIDGLFGRSWSQKDTTTKGLVIKLKMLRSPSMRPFNSGYLIFEASNKETKIIEPCLGLMPGSEGNIWLLNLLDTGEFYEIASPKNEKVEYVNLLFQIPSKVMDGMLKYRNEAVVEKIKITGN